MAAWAPGPCAKLAILLVCAFIGAGTNLFIAASHKLEDAQGPGGVHYLYISVTLLNETLKFLLGSAAYLCARCCGAVGDGASSLTARESLLYSVPAFLYMFDNNLIFVILRYVDPPTVSILWNVKIVITALLFRLTFKKAFSRQKWMAVLLLLVGCVTTQADKVRAHAGGGGGGGGGGSMAHSTAQCAAEMATMDAAARNASLAQAVLLHEHPLAMVGHKGVAAAHDAAATHHHHGGTAAAAAAAAAAAPMSSWAFGMLLILLGTTVTSLAGVYSEWVLKRQKNLNFFLQNMQMNGYGVLLNGLALLVVNGAELREHGMLAGYNKWTWATIASQATFGLLTAAVFKYLDNITNVYKNATTMIITMVASALFLDFHPSLTFGCGFVICCISLLLYNVTAEWLSATDAKAKAPSLQEQQRRERERQERRGMLRSDSDDDEEGGAGGGRGGGGGRRGGGVELVRK